MAHENVRMGGGGASGPPWKLIGICLGAAVVIGLVVLFVSLPEEEDDVRKPWGCQSDADCKTGSVCLARGCLILLSSELPDMWRDDVASQLDAGVPWEPRPTFGKKVLPASECPADVGAVEKPDESRAMPVLKVSVFELTDDGLRVHKQMAAKGAVWLDALRFWLPPGIAIGTGETCSSPGVDRIAVGQGRWRGKTAHYVDVSLKQAAPAGKVTGATVMVKTELPAADKEGTRTLAIGLDPVFEEHTSEHTVVALPLGSDVVAIEGPPPTGQRLLSGFVGYYWEHADLPSELAVRFRLPPVSGSVLDVTELNP
jgi:hypothetical protein